MENKSLMEINPANLVPEDERAIDGRAIDMNSTSNVKVELMGISENIVTAEDKAEDAEKITSEFEKAANLGIISPVSGMGKITGILDDRIYARIIETENGDRYIEFCEQYENGQLSPRFKVAQENLIIGAMCGFQPQTITKESEIAYIKSDVVTFMKNIHKEYCKKYNGNHMHNIVEILAGLCEAYKQLPVEKEDIESVVGVFYDELVKAINELMYTDCSEHKSYYVILDSDIDYIAKKFHMKRLEFLKLLKRYNLLYLTPSSRGYQTNIRFKKAKENGVGLEWNYTQWVYCIYNLKYLNSLKEEQTGEKADKEQEPEIYPEL